MMYDIQILVPFCRKFGHRIEDFKKYGIFNTKGRRVLVTALTSNYEEIDGLKEGWHEGVEVVVKQNVDPNHTSNIYRFYAELKAEDLNSKWLMRVDDDSCTDVGRLLDNLELFYEWEDRFYLGDLCSFESPLSAGEIHVYHEYKHLLGAFEKIAPFLKNEIECGIISHGGMLHMLNNENCMRLIRQRAELKGGFGDCVTAIGAATSKLYALQCPFISHLPLINEFSAFGGRLNHIHMISRENEGENFHNRCGKIQYEALIRAIEGTKTEMETSLWNKKFIMETERELTMYEFLPNNILKVKFDNNRYIWTEQDGAIHIFCDAINVFRKFHPEGSSLVGLGDGGEKIILKPVA